MKTNLSLQMLLQNQSSPDVVINENFTKLDAFAFNRVIDFAVQLPLKPENGDMYILSPLHKIPNNVALFIQNKGWIYFSPKNGWRFFIENLQVEYCFANSSWNPVINRAVNSDWNATDGVTQILNKPNLFDGNYNNLYNKPEIKAVVEQYSIGDFKRSMQSDNHGKWILCNGQELSRTTYSALFALIGTAFGVGDNATRFNTPDCRGKVNGSSGQGVGLTNRANGQTVGAENHTLTIAEMPNHNHNQSTGYATSGYYGFDNLKVGSAFFNQGDGFIMNSDRTSKVGGGQSHNNMQPTIFIGNTFIYAGV